MNKVPMADFPSIAFQATLGTTALLFVVFGFLYTVFGAYSGKERPPIVAILRRMCRAISIIIFLSAGLTIYALILFVSEVPANGHYIVITIGVSLTLFIIAIFSLVWAWRYMN